MNVQGHLKLLKVKYTTGKNWVWLHLHRDTWLTCNAFDDYLAIWNVARFCATDKPFINALITSAQTILYHKEYIGNIYVW